MTAPIVSSNSRQKAKFTAEYGPATTINSTRADALRDGARASGVIGAVLKIVEEETAALRASGGKEVEKFAERKGQALMSLNRLLADGTVVAAHSATATRLKVLRAALEENRSLLKMHIDAVTEVSQIIVRCVQNSHSDGTYSQPRKPYGQF